jgi:hypothetical protein
MPSEDGQLTETCKGDKYLQIESHWTVLTIIILKFRYLSCCYMIYATQLLYMQISARLTFCRRMNPKPALVMEAQQLTGAEHRAVRPEPNICRAINAGRMGGPWIVSPGPWIHAFLEATFCALGLRGLTRGAEGEDQIYGTGTMTEETKIPSFRRGSRRFTSY